MPEFVIRRVKSVAKFGNDLTDSTWQSVKWTELTRAGRQDAPREPVTRFTLVHDAQTLLLGCRCTGVTPNAAANEVAQVMFDTAGDGVSIARFVCFPHGRLRARRTYANGRDEPWQGIVSTHARICDGGWEFRLAASFAQFQFPLGNRSLWRFNLVRIIDHADPEAWMSYGPLTSFSEFRKPQQVVATAKFDDPMALQAYQWTMEPAARGTVHDVNGRRVWRQPLRIINSTAQQSSIELSVGLDAAQHQSAEPVRRILNQPAGEAGTEIVDITAPEDREYGWVKVHLRDPGSSKLLCERRFSIEPEPLAWKEHFIKRGDGKGGYTCLRESQFMPRYQGRRTIPYGLAAMDNGEVMMVGAALADGTSRDQTIIGISPDGGATWGEWIALPNVHCRPMMLAYLGRGVVTFESGDTTAPQRFYSHDFGRTWGERIAVPLAPDGLPIGFEGNALIDHDARGNATAIAQIGQTLQGGYPDLEITEYFRWSYDGGRTWPVTYCPEPWRWTEEYRGKTYRFSGGEGGLVRAANGWIVAGLRTCLPPKYFDHPYAEDSFEGTAVSLSKDDGKTWSNLKTIFEPGRHHANLIKMPNGDLVMTVIRRMDYRNGAFASYRRGCDAVVSRDNGLTWDVDHLYVLDDFAFCSGDQWVNGECGHLFTTLLDDGNILTAYGNYLAGGILIKWHP